MKLSDFEVLPDQNSASSQAIGPFDSLDRSPKLLSNTKKAIASSHLILLSLPCPVALRRNTKPLTRMNLRGSQAIHALQIRDRNFVLTSNRREILSPSDSVVIPTAVFGVGSSF